MSHSSPPQHHHPIITSPPPVVFGQVPVRQNAIVPTMVPMGGKSGSSSIVSVYMSFFARRSFHRVALIVGLGSAAVAGWFIYQRYLSEKAKREQLPIEGTSVAENTNEVDQNSNDVSETGDYLLDKNVILYQCPRGYFTPCIAPFALKLETFLRVANIPYEIKFKGQPQADDAPWITIGKMEIVESQKCIPTLCQIFNIDISKESSESRKTAANLVDNTLDNRIFWGIALWRWVYDSGNSMKEIQPVAVPMASQMIQDVSESVKKAAWYHGIGRHSEEEVVEKVSKDLNDLSVALGKHNYFMGERPGEVDCNAFAMFSQMVWNMPGSPFELEIKKYSNLVGFIFRMKEKYWPDWNDILHSSDTESMASESVRLYSTGEFTRSRTGVSAKSSKSSSIHLSREPSISSTSRGKKSNSEINRTNLSRANSKDRTVREIQNAKFESEVRKVNSERSSSRARNEIREQQIQNSVTPSQSQPEYTFQNTNSPVSNPFREDARNQNNVIPQNGLQNPNNMMSQHEINNFLSALANDQIQHSNQSQIPEYYPNNQATTNFNFNGQQQYQNSFVANKTSQFPGQTITAPNQPLATNAYQQNVHNPQQQYGNYDSAYHDQAKYYQIRDAIHAVTASTGPRESYSANITKLNQILNDLTISKPQNQNSFEHPMPLRQWSTPVGHQPQQQQQQMYYTGPTYGHDQQQQQQQQQQTMMNSYPHQIPNSTNPFM